MKFVSSRLRKIKCACTRDNTGISPKLHLRGEQVKKVSIQASVRRVG